MKNIIYSVTFVLLIAVRLLMAQDKSEKDFEHLTSLIIENLNWYFPVNATIRGIHEYDNKFTDYSKKSINVEISKLKEFKKRLQEFDKSNLSENSTVNLKLITSNVDIAILNLGKIRWHENNPYLYINEAINGVYLILVSDYAPLEQRANDVISRMRAVPKLLKQAKNNIKNPPPTFIRLAHRMTDDGINLYRNASNGLLLELPELSLEINRAADIAITAIEQYKNYLENVIPGPEGSFAIGKQNFDFKLQHEYMLDYNSDSLLKIGENLLTEIDQRITEFNERNINDVSEVDSIYIIDCLKKEDIFNYYSWEVDQIKLFLQKKNLLTIPENIGACMVIETPEFLRSIISSIAYEPPGVFSPSQTGYFYVRPLPDNMNAEEKADHYRYIYCRDFRSSVVHEAYPGHHLHFQKIAKLTDANRLQSSCGNVFFTIRYLLQSQIIPGSRTLYHRHIGAGPSLNLLSII